MSMVYTLGLPHPEEFTFNMSNYQAYEFIGLNDDYGIITHGGYFSRINLKTFETKNQH